MKKEEPEDDDVIFDGVAEPDPLAVYDRVKLEEDDKAALEMILEQREASEDRAWKEEVMEEVVSLSLFLLD